MLVCVSDYFGFNSVGTYLACTPLAFIGPVRTIVSYYGMIPKADSYLKESVEMSQFTMTLTFASRMSIVVVVLKPNNE